MSMLSSKCDGLRNVADELQNLIDNGHNYTCQGFVGTLRYAQQGLRDAADTICKLADVVDQSEEIERLEAENAKLRELVRKYGEYTDQDRCEGCVCKSRCNDGDVDECWQLTEIRGLARELEIEVR